MSRNGFIYKITNTSNGKVYIGQTVSKVKYRWTTHKGDARTGRVDYRLTRAIRKYGNEAFTIETLVEVPRDLLNAAEVAFISICKSRDREFGYNTKEGGAATAEEFYKKKSDGNSGELNPFFGKTHSEETRKHLSEIRKGVVSWNKGISPSEETRVKIAETLKGNTPWNLGKSATEEHKRKLSESHKGIKPSAETTAKRIKSLTGQKRSPEQKERMSAAKRGKKNSEAHNQSVSNAVKALWADPVYRENMLRSRREKAALKKAA